MRGAQPEHHAVAVSAPVVGLRPAKSQHAPVDRVHAPAGTLHQSDALHGIGQRGIAGPRLGDEQVGHRDAVDQPARIADGQSVIVEPDVHGAEAVVVAMHQGVGNGFTE